MNQLQELTHITELCVQYNIQECVPWSGALDRDGYGHVREGQLRHKAHRKAYDLVSADLKRGSVVLHTCDNPSCVNPKHLQQGTQADNMADKVSKSRQVRGEAKNGILSEQDVKQMRELTSYIPNVKIAKLFGVCRQSVDNIINRVTWKHVGGDLSLG